MSPPAKDLNKTEEKEGLMKHWKRCTLAKNQRDVLFNNRVGGPWWKIPRGSSIFGFYCILINKLFEKFSGSYPVVHPLPAAPPSPLCALNIGIAFKWFAKVLKSVKLKLLFSNHYKFEFYWILFDWFLWSSNLWV